MEITAEQLRQNFSYKDTEELLDIRARNQLTEVARTAIEEELSARGVAKEAVAAVLAQQLSAQSATDKFISNLAPRSLRLLAKLIDVFGGLALLRVIISIRHTCQQQYHQGAYVFLRK